MSNWQLHSKDLWRLTRPSRLSLQQFFFAVSLIAGGLACSPSDKVAGESHRANSATAKLELIASKTGNCDIQMTSVAALLGVNFQDIPVNPTRYEAAAIVGAGCAIYDLDNDGIPEILLLRMRTRDDMSGSKQPGIGLFRQTTDGQFIDATRKSGLDTCLGGAGVAIADCNNDGWPDLLITSPYDVSLWLNNGAGKFNDVTQTAGIDHAGWAISASWFDYDRDGWLDLFVTNYLENTNLPCTSLSGGKQDFCSPLLFEPTTDRLYRNTSGDSKTIAGAEADVRFVDVTVESGISTASSAGMGSLAVDFTNDGWPDVYVASDQRPNRLWINQQNGRFLEQAVHFGCDADFQGRMQASMGLAFGSVESPEYESIIVSHLSGEFHAVYSPIPNGFVERSRETGIGTLTRPYTGFGVALADLDCNGSNELLTVNGRVARPNSIPQNDAEFWAPYREPIQLQQRSNGVYQPIDFDAEVSLHLARGLSIGDLDSDGDVDALISTIGEPAIILRNDSVRAGHWIGIRATDANLGKRTCPGAVLLIKTTNGIIRSTLQPCQSYASTHQDLVHVGLGLVQNVEWIDVLWPHADNRTERFEPAEEVGLMRVDKVHVLVRGQGRLIKTDR